MLENDVYNFTIATMIYFVLMFDLSKMESTTNKYKLVCCFAQIPLFPDHLILYLFYRDSKKAKRLR